MSGSSPTKPASSTSINFELKRSIREDQFGLISSILLHIIGAFIFLNVGSIDEEPPEEPVIAVEMVALTALGEPPPPKVLPRIVAPPPPPEDATKEISISREIKEEEKPKPKKEKPKPKKKKPKPKKKKPKKRKRKRVSKSDLFSGLSQEDPRADRGPRHGDRRGSIEGTSTKWNGNVVSAYVSRVSNTIKRHFKPPASIDKKTLNKLKTTVYVKLKPIGQRVAQVTGRIRCKKCSGNKFFDDAALRALKKFTEEGGAKLPLPKSEIERKSVLQNGFTLIFRGKDLL